MKNLTQFLFMLLCICLPATAFADANKDKDDDSKYLAGAVPEVDGKVVFTKEFSIPGMSQEEIFKRMQAWMEARLKKNANTSRVVYTLSLIHISEPTRQAEISYAVFCLKKKKR